MPRSAARLAVSSLRMRPRVAASKPPARCTEVVNARSMSWGDSSLSRRILPAKSGTSSPHSEDAATARVPVSAGDPPRRGSTSSGATPSAACKRSASVTMSVSRRVCPLASMRSRVSSGPTSSARSTSASIAIADALGSGELSRGAASIVVTCASGASSNASQSSAGTWRAAVSGAPIRRPAP